MKKRIPVRQIVVEFHDGILPGIRLTRNPNLEIRDPKEIRSPKPEARELLFQRPAMQHFFHPLPKLISAFGFRISGLSQSVRAILQLLARGYKLLSEVGNNHTFVWGRPWKERKPEGDATASPGAQAG